MNWDAQELNRRIEVRRDREHFNHQKRTEESSWSRNLLLLTITILMFVQVGFSVVGEMRYQEIKSQMETVVEKWTGGSKIFDTPIDPQ